MLPELVADFAGQIITPDSAGYDQARRVFYGGLDHRPEAILRPAGAEDVSRTVTFARESGMELAIRSGGHSLAGHSTSDGGIVLDLSSLRALHIDAERRTAWAEAGLTTGEYTRATGAYGLATGFGDTDSVGIGGITLGGGIGYLVRQYGLTIDSLLAAEIVTADGQVRQVNPESHPDLFWAIRGGGGNFGVITRFQFRLHPVDQIVGGMLVLPATPGVLQSMAEAAEAAPESLSIIANVMPAPPMPFVPDRFHGRLVVMLMPVYAGPLEHSERVLAPFRALANPIVDQLRPMRYPEIYPPDEPGYHPMAVNRSHFIDRLDRCIAEKMIDSLQSTTAQTAVVQVRVLGGAMARVPVEATAFAHRQRRILLSVAALYDDPDQAAAQETWVASAAASMRQGEPGVYVNFLANESQARVREAYPGKTWERLVAIKARYDPDNLFRRNQNILPQAE